MKLLLLAFFAAAFVVALAAIWFGWTCLSGTCDGPLIGLILFIVPGLVLTALCVSGVRAIFS